MPQNLNVNRAFLKNKTLTCIKVNKKTNDFPFPVAKHNKTNNLPPHKTLCSPHKYQIFRNKHTSTHNFENTLMKNTHKQNGRYDRLIKQCCQKRLTDMYQFPVYNKLFLERYLKYFCCNSVVLCRCNSVLDHINTKTIISAI